MANSDKNLTIRPRINEIANPVIEFVGADAGTGPQTITAEVTPADQGTVTFAGTSGTILTLADNATYKLDINGATRIDGDFTVTGTTTISGSTTFDTDIVPNTDNTGNVGTAALTWADGQFTNFTVDSTLTTTNLNIGADTIAEYIADTVGAMVTSNTESGISVTYQDADNTLDFNVDDFSITLTGDVTGSGTVTNLGNVSFATSIAANSVALGTDTTGNYVATIAGTTNQVTVTGSGSETAAVTLSLPQNIHTGASPTFAGATLDNIQVGVTGTNEIDTSSGNLTIDSAGGTVIIDDELTVTGLLTVSHAGDEILRLQDDSAAGSPFITMYQSTTERSRIGYRDTGDYIYLYNSSNGEELRISNGVNGLKWLGNGTEYTVFHTGNDGTGSGLDADTVDGTELSAITHSGDSVGLTGDVTGSTTVASDGSISIATSIAANSVALGTDTTGSYVQQGATSGNGISGSVNSEGGTFTVTSNATDANTSSTIVFRNASGNFSANQITLAGDIVPDTDNTGNVGTTALTWNNGQFTNLTVNSTLSVRAAIDLADNDDLRFGSSDDYIIDFDATNLVIHRNVGGNILITDTDNSTKFIFAPATGAFTTTGNVTVGGDLTVSGTTTTINTETLNLADNIIVLNSNETLAPTQNSGIEVERGTATNVVLQWNETSDHWEIASGGTTGRILTTGDEGTGNGLDADTVDSLQASQFLRSDADDTTTGTLIVEGSLRTDTITNRSGQQLVLNAGESAGQATGQTAEFVYVNAEDGLQINSSTDNWVTGWAGRNTAIINDANGNSSLPGNLSVSGDLTVDTNTLYVDSTNNRVGFGTTSPSAVLDVVTTSGGSVKLAGGSNLVGESVYIKMQDRASFGYNAGTIEISDRNGSGTTTNKSFSINLNNAERFAVSTSGETTTTTITTTGKIIAGSGSGSVAMTVNDGYGNANIAFNHQSGVPDVTGSSARIETSVDSATAAMLFELGNSTTSGVAVTLSPILGMSTSAITAYVDVLPNNNNTKNLGSASLKYNTVYATLFNGTALEAYYADLAENYEADSAYEPGTVLVFGGEKELTTTNTSNNFRVAGVVSTEPATLMNSKLEGDTVVPLALQGRVPCKVIGRVEKGDMIVTSSVPGYGMVNNQPTMGTVIGKAVGVKTDANRGLVEVVVGRV